MLCGAKLLQAMFFSPLIGFISTHFFSFIFIYFKHITLRLTSASGVGLAGSCKGHDGKHLCGAVC